MPAILGSSRWPLVRVLPTFHLDSTKTRIPTIRVPAEEVSVPWVGGAGPPPPLPLPPSLVGDVENGVQQSCTMARVVLLVDML